MSLQPLWTRSIEPLSLQPRSTHLLFALERRRSMRPGKDSADETSSSESMPRGPRRWTAHGDRPRAAAAIRRWRRRIRSLRPTACRRRRRGRSRPARRSRTTRATRCQRRRVRRLPPQVRSRSRKRSRRLRMRRRRLRHNRSRSATSGRWRFRPTTKGCGSRCRHRQPQNRQPTPTPAVPQIAAVPQSSAPVTPAVYNQPDAAPSGPWREPQIPQSGSPVVPAPFVQPQTTQPTAPVAQQPQPASAAPAMPVELRAVPSLGVAPVEPALVPPPRMRFPNLTSPSTWFSPPAANQQLIGYMVPAANGTSQFVPIEQMQSPATDPSQQSASVANSDGFRPRGSTRVRSAPRFPI